MVPRLLREYVTLFLEAGWASYETMVTNSSKPRYQLPNGVTLVDVSNASAIAEDSAEWFFYDDATQEKVGSFSLYTYPEIGKTINMIGIDASVRGKGLGGEAVKVLAKHYGSVSSDPQANTSDAAVRMWKRLGAEKVSTHLNTKGYFYRLVG